MTRIRGFLEGAQGPLNGRLYVRASAAFIGAPEGDLAFRIKDGEVDISLPPTPRSAPYFVDWRNVGDTRGLTFPERWLVPAVEEVELDALRGYKKEVMKRKGDGRGSVVENVALQAENESLTKRIAEVEQQHAQALKRLSSIEAQLAAATGKSASLEAELIKERAMAKKPSAPAAEKIVERKVAIGQEEWRERLAAETERRTLVEQELAALKEQFNERLALANHFGALHNEIDRLNLEKQQLLARIDGLKAPRRSLSSYKAEAIAELDKMMSS